MIEGQERGARRRAGQSPVDLGGRSARGEAVSTPLQGQARPYREGGEQKGKERLAHDGATTDVLLVV